LAETPTQFDVLFQRRSITDFIVVPLRRRSVAIQSLTACVWLRTDDLLNYGTLWSYAVDSNWLAADSNAFTAYDYANLKVARSTCTLAHTADYKQELSCHGGKASCRMRFGIQISLA